MYHGNSVLFNSLGSIAPLKNGAEHEDMDVAGDDEIDGILIQCSFEHFLTFCADGAAHVPRLITS